MKILLINGGPHEKGSTNVALEEVAKTLNENNIETEIMWLGNNPIGGCIGCNYCLKNNNRCFMKDKVNEFLDKVEETDGFVFGSPVHFAAASGALTSFLDRVFYGRGKIFKNKVAASVVSCRRGGATAAFDQINKYALMSNMYIVGSSYWNQIHGNNAEENGIQKPQYEEKIKTNFIR